jgi:sugar porter (SP) family MFS transporter
MALSKSYALLLFGRFFVGVGVGIGLAIDPLYIAEISPAKHRGQLVTWSEIAINVGIVIGFATRLLLKPIADGTEWRVMFLAGTFLPTAMIFLVLFVMPESPRWLVANNRDAEARDVLKQVYPDGYNVERVIDGIKEALQRDFSARNAVGWETILSPTPAFGRMMLVGVGTAVAQQVVGIDAIQYYLLDVLEESGINSETKETMTLIFLGFLKLAFILVGGKLFDEKGRRPLFFVSLAGMAGALLLVSFAFVQNDRASTKFVVCGLALYLSFFSIGMGPGAWLIPSEVFAQSIRAKAMSVATVLNRLTATLMSSTFLSLANAVGWSAFFLMLSIVCVLVFAFIYFFLPETKGRSLEEMSIYFADVTGDASVLEADAKIRMNLDAVEMARRQAAQGENYEIVRSTHEVV